MSSLERDAHGKVQPNALGALAVRDIEIDGQGAAGFAVPLIFSAIVPGLGQLRQQRLAIGTITFVCVASWVLQMMGPLIAIVRKTAEVHPLLPAIAVAGYAFIWGVSLLDTYLAARAEARR